VAGQRGLAYKVRTGLEVVVNNPRASAQAAAKQTVLDVVSFRKTARQHVKEFGCLFGVIGLGCGAFGMWKGWTPTPIYLASVAGAIFAVLGYAAPIVLHPVWKAWMAIGEGMGFVVSLVFLGITWCAITTPIGWVAKLSGKKLLDLRYRDACASYWETRDPALDNVKFYERQY
jgi:hypothetical protein